MDKVKKDYLALPHVQEKLKNGVPRKDVLKG